jgi:type VII secretion protein EccCb
VIRWFDRQKAKVKKQEGGDVRSIADRVVEVCAEIANTRSDVVKQEKPWPDPLPVYVPLNAERISAAMRKTTKVADPLADAEEEGEDETTIIADEEENDLLPLNRLVNDWLRDIDRWLPVVWDSDKALSARIGMIDDPHHARQLPFDLDMKAGSVLMFGASGKGKTGFLRTLTTSLAVSHSPEALWIYALDFGGGGLSPLIDLPHVGAVIGNEEGERVERLINRLKDWARQRSELFGGDNLTTYNKMHPTELVPAVLVLIDNFAEFRQSYEDLIPDLSSLIREGLSKGIYFAVTADQLGSVPGRMQSLFNQRMTLKLADAADYSGVVGRVQQDLDDIPGRGYMVVDRLTLEMQIAKPVQVEGLTTVDGEPLDDSGQLAYLISLMKKAWRGSVVPQTIDKLATIVPLADLVDLASDRRVEVMLGIERRELTPVPLNLKEQGPHFIISGSPFSGKSTTLRTMILSLADHYSPERVAFILIDAQKKLFDYAEGRTLANLPHVQLAISEQNREMVEPVIESLKQTFINKNGTALPEIFVFIDNYDDFSDLFDRKSKPLTDLANVARRYGSEGLHVVIATGASASEDLFKVLTRSKTGLALDAEAAGKPPFNLTSASKLAKLTLPVGRGFLISSAKASMLQVSTPYVIENADEIQDILELQTAVNEQLDVWVDRIMKKWEGAPRWTFQFATPDPSADKNAGGAGAGARAASSAAPSGPTLPDVFVVKLRGALKGLGMMPEKDIDALDTMGVVNAADAMDDLIEWGALATEANLNPADLIPGLMALGSPEAEARKKLGLLSQQQAEPAGGGAAVVAEPETAEQPK